MVSIALKGPQATPPAVAEAMEIQVGGRMVPVVIPR
jgi:hypothetical protein